MCCLYLPFYFWNIQDQTSDMTYNNNNTCVQKYLLRYNLTFPRRKTHIVTKERAFFKKTPMFFD